MKLTLITGPSVEPVSLDEVRQYLRMDEITEDDALIQSLIVAARTHLDGYSGALWGRCLNTQTWRLDLECFKDVDFELGPLQSITSVEYYDTDDTLQTVASAIYEAVGVDTMFGGLRRLADQSWPTDVNAHMGYPVQVTFVVGHGDSWNDVPQPIRQAIMLLACHWYENREPVNIGNITTALPMTVQYLLTPYGMVGSG